MIFSRILFDKSIMGILGAHKRVFWDYYWCYNVTDHLTSRLICVKKK